eukprot:TRINITY_DN361_c0_g1_i14.p1 TRINITY_DN361_c0_g1~~TRINITY_DN361_c0_g1_i14.p1  ORF type:complete len:405 (-),score=146.64 TRINITY_DN361_c0_g1_i14:137-1351(-)
MMIQTMEMTTKIQVMKSIKVALRSQRVLLPVMLKADRMGWMKIIPPQGKEEGGLLKRKKLQRGKKKAVIENDEDEERDEEKDAARGGSKTRSKRKERMLDSTKMKEPTGKKRRKKTDEDHEAFFSEMRGIAKNLVSRMHQAAEKDRSNFRKETPSFEKMLLLEEVEAIAKKERMYGILVEAGLIKAFADWLKPLDLDGDGKELPSVDTRDRILALLQWIPMAGELEGHGNLDEDDLEMFEGISLNTLVESEIGKVLVHLLNSPEETRENKRIITRVLQRIAAVVAEEEGVEDAFPQGNEMPESIQRKAESEMAKESAKPLIPRTLPSKVRGRIGTELDLDTLAQIRHVYPTEETFAFKHRPEKSATMEKMEKEFLMKKYRPSVAPTRRTKKGGGSGSASSRRRR